MNTRLLAATLLVLAFPAVGLADPDIDVTPTSHDFGNVTVGNSSTTGVNLANVGEHPLTVQVIVMGPGSSADISVTDAPAVPFTVNPTDSVDLEVTFSPSAAGVASATLEIYSDDIDEGLVEVSLAGVGVADEPADPPIEGNVNGIELCPKFVCGKALFTGYFSGQVDGQRAFGTWFASIDHDELPGPDDPVFAGDGQWILRTWVRSGFFFSRQTFSGDFGSGTLTNEGGNIYRAVVPMTITSGGSGGLTLDLYLDENRFPQRVNGTLTPVTD